MLTAKRKHHHRRVNEKLNCRHLCWPGRGIGKHWKRRLHKARRKFAKDTLHGRRGKEPVGLESEVNWKTW